MTRRRTLLPAIKQGFLSVLLLLLAGCANEPAAPGVSGTSGAYSSYDSYYGSGEITFIDDLKTNVDVGDNLEQLAFVDIDGNETQLADYLGEKSVVLVITRGNTDPICPYCSTQTSRLITNYDDFAARGAEVLVVYPIEHGNDAQRLDAFLQDSKTRLDDPAQPVPFPILLDVELKAVDTLGIRKDLSKPATYILGPDRQVHFAYVGASLDDRPSVKAMLAELDKLSGESPDATSANQPQSNAVPASTQIDSPETPNP